MENSFVSAQNPHRWESEMVKTRRWIWLRKKRLAKFHIKKRDTLLDLGCGDGLNMKILWDMGIKDIVGVDISKKLLQTAKANLPWGSFVLASGERLPFQANTFDVILADSVLYHFLGKEKAIREMNRVLKKGGKLFFVEGHHSFLRKVLDIFTILPMSRHLPFFKGRREAFLAEEKAIRTWHQKENDFLRKLEKIGFKKLSLRYNLFSVIGMYQKI